jgi:hypothetical protein
MTEEIWKDIPGYEGLYQVSDQGRVRNAAGRQLALCNVSGGYKAVSLGRNNSKTVHRLVAAAFLEPAPEGARLVLHGDGNRTNNRVDNLRYGSYLDNARDAQKHGTQAKGERQHAAKLTADEVLAIRSSPASIRTLAAQLNVTPQCIQLIRARKNWRHV